MHFKLLKFTNTKHFDSVAVTEWPESIDSSGLPDLHVDTGGVRCRWNRPPLPEICTSERGQQVANRNRVLLIKWAGSSPIWPAWCGSVEINAGVSPLPLEDPLVLVGLALQPQGVLAQGLRVVELVIDELDQAVQFSPRLQSDQLADRAADRWCLKR